MVLTQPIPIQASQPRLFPRPTGDPRLLVPGWGGDLSPDEFDFVQDELIRDKKLAYEWGFRPNAKGRPEWALRQVTQWGQPDSRTANLALARHPMPQSVPSENPEQA